MNSGEIMPDIISVASMTSYRQQYETYEETAAYLARCRSEFMGVVKPFHPRVVGGLALVDAVEYLRVVGDHKVGQVRRHISGVYEEGVSFSTAPSIGVDVIAYVEPWDSELLDRGLSWVSVTEESSPIFKMWINHDHRVPETEIAERLREVEAKTVRLIEGVLESDPNPPFARKFVSSEL